EVEEQRFHGAVRGVWPMPHQVARDLPSVRPRPDVRERLDPSVTLEDRGGEAGQVELVEGAEREPLLGGLVLGEPLVRDEAQLGQEWGNLVWRQHTETRARPLDA